MVRCLLAILLPFFVTTVGALESEKACLLVDDLSLKNCKAVENESD